MPGPRPVIYIAGPYTGPKPRPDDYLAIDRNIARAREAAAELARCDVWFFSPHLHSAHFEAVTPDVPPEFWYGLDVHFLKHCTAILLLEGWANSKGTLEELRLAQEWGIPAYQLIDELLQHQGLLRGDG